MVEMTRGVFVAVCLMMFAAGAAFCWGLEGLL